jgi:S-formylglutathione hydrolase
MGSYVNQELPALVEANFPVALDRRGIFGHSMGGHGALVTALRQPRRWHSLSALAPICHPSAVPWGQKAFTGYLGADPSQWRAYDASLLMRERAYPGPILVDQGEADPFLARELQPEALEAAAQHSGQVLTVRRHANYDHGYYFIQTFVGAHLRHHAALLKPLI